MAAPFYKLIAMFDHEPSADWFHKTLIEGGLDAELSYGDAVFVWGEKAFLDELAKGHDSIVWTMMEPVE